MGATLDVTADVLTATGQADATYDNTSGAILLEDRDHLRIATVNPRCVGDGLKVGDNVIVEGRFDLAPAASSPARDPFPVSRAVHRERRQKAWWSASEVLRLTSRNAKSCLVA
ncbi:hypothetical protein ABZ815_30170 [Nonomuraea sp. NPDC047529]|uniref:hypothetical protein n=1 Tax=Nonomuraea sp. NPDC047529 TaxID=3155623 RepID=UPI0033C0FBB1